MLKIRDDADLKGLKEYGFETDFERGLYKYWVGNTQLLRINMWDRKIKIMQLYCSLGETRNTDEQILNVLGDLFQAGLVEKVSD